MATAGASRRALFGRLRGDGIQLRPPWSRADDLFTEACNLCGACLRACPSGIIVPGRANYPIVDFTLGSCTFCAQCRDACESDCFEPDPAHQPWALQAHVQKNCVEASGVTCRICQDKCAHGAILFQPLLGGCSQPSVLAERCTGCGACVGACPVRAISVDIPQRQAEEVPA